MSKSLKKIMTASAALLMLASVGAASSNPANAKHYHHTRMHRMAKRYWHAGVPNVMKGTWHIGQHNTALTHIYHNYITEFHHYAPVDAEDISHMAFHYQGHGNYIIKGLVHNGAVSNKYHHITLHAHMYNHHKMYYSGIRHGRYTDAAIYIK